MSQKKKTKKSSTQEKVEKLISKEIKSDDKQINYYLGKMQDIRIQYDLTQAKREDMQRGREQLERYFIALDAKYDQYRENIKDWLEEDTKKAENGAK